MSVVAVIPARGGSKGIPKKNVRPLAGFPLIDWVLTAVAQSETPTVIAVTSDDDTILKHAVRVWGRKDGRGRVLHCLRRPADLAQDDTPDLPVAQHAVVMLHLKADDLMVWLRPTAPFVQPADIDAVVELATHCDLPTASVRSVILAHQHPAKMYSHATLVHSGVTSPTLVPFLGRDAHRANHPRQGLTPIWLAAGYVDAMRVGTIQAGEMDGWPILAWPVPTDRAIDLDTEDDWKRAGRGGRC